MKKKSPRKEHDYQVLMAILKVAGLLQKAGNRFFKEYDLTQSQFNVLILLAHDFPQGCIQNELSQNLLVNPADMTGLVKRMLKQEFIERRPHPRDERAKIVRITAKGKNLFERVEKKYYRKVKNLMIFLSGQESEILMAQMIRLECKLREVVK
jgi:DNA-binding MarR family transcriptional regulator